jgi:hypothetical protein
MTERLANEKPIGPLVGAQGHNVELTGSEELLPCWAPDSDNKSLLCHRTGAQCPHPSMAYERRS